MTAGAGRRDATQGNADSDCEAGELDRKVLEAKKGRDKATAAAAETKKLYAELQNVHGEQQKALAVERARVKQLEEEKQKLTTTLEQ